jgi:hypothetical protein
LIPSLAAPPLRKRASDYADGSPAPRYSALPEKRSSVLLSSPFKEEQDDGYAGHLDHLSDFVQDQRAKGVQMPTKVPDQEIETHDFQLPKRVRQRKSFLGSFQKRAADYDTALPPFNHAGSKIAAPDPGLSLGGIPGIKIEQRKTRNFSETLKGRLKKVFRKASKMSMPVQHVHAKDFHFAVRDVDFSEASMVDYTDPFMTVAAEDPEPSHQQKSATSQSAASTAQDSTSRSRVTSWANSTLPISSVRTANGPFAVPGTADEPDLTMTEHQEASPSPPPFEPAILHRSESASTLRKASSFFGRPIRNKLRRASKTDLRGSGESHGLYSALQSRIRISRSTEDANEVNVSAPVGRRNSQGEKSTSALATLPSQRQYSTSSALTSSISSQNRYRSASGGLKSGDHLAHTIRPVTPELAPVMEAASAEADRTVIHHEVESPSDSTPKSALRRSHAVKAAPPSKEQLLKRKERAENRWTTALTTGRLSPQMVDNPYELPSLSHRDRARSPQQGLPYASRANVISPSLYSRATLRRTSRGLERSAALFL